MLIPLQISPLGLDLMGCSNWSLLLPLAAPPPDQANEARGRDLLRAPSRLARARLTRQPQAARPWRAPLFWAATRTCLAVADFHDAHTSLIKKKTFPKE